MADRRRPDGNVKTETVRRRTTTGSPAVRGFALVGWVARKLGGNLPKPRNSFVAMIELPYVLIRVVVLLAVLVPVLALTVIWLLVRLVLALPMMIVGTVASTTSVTAGSHITNPGQPPMVDQSVGERDDQLALMSGGDPERLMEGALDRAAALWEARHRSIALNDGDLVRPAMTEGFWRVHCMLLDARAANGVDRVFDSRIVDSMVIGATHSGIVDEVGVRLFCEGICYDRSVNPDMLLRGTTVPGRWNEDVVLRRSSDVLGLSSDAAVATVITTCPNCGADLDVEPDGSCRTCGALIAGQPTDWVLDNAWRAQW